MGKNNPAEDGYNAYYSNEPETTNPYIKGTPDYDAWLRGWKEAETDDLEERLKH